MRLHFVVTCVAGAVSIVSIGSRAEPYNATIVPARSPPAARPELSAEKHMSPHNLDEEERVFTTAEVELALHPQKWDESMSKFLSQDVKAVDLFKLLGLHKALNNPVNNILVSFKLAYLEKFMELYNKKNGNNPAETLLNLCDSNDMANDFYKKLLEVNGLTTRDELQSLLDMTTPEQVYNKLHGRMAKKNALPRLSRLTKWVNYAEAFDTVYNDHALIAHLVSLGYIDTALVDVLIPLRRLPKDGSNKDRILNALMKVWLADKLDPMDVFRLLGLDNVEAKATIVEGPLIQKWMDYVDKSNAMTTEPKSYLSRLELLMKPEFSKDYLMRMLHKNNNSPTAKRMRKNQQQLLEKEEEKLDREAGRDKADLGKVDKHLDAVSYIPGMKRKKNEEELTSPGMKRKKNAEELASPTDI